MTITYKVEESVNDSDVDFLTATVSLDSYISTSQLPNSGGTIHQTWIEIPLVYKHLATPISALQDNDGVSINKTLFCNLGAAIEGTNKVFILASKYLLY